MRASTIRKVQTESATGSSTSNRIRTTLTIRVESVDFDTQACMLRLKGRNIQENQYVKVSRRFKLFADNVNEDKCKVLSSDMVNDILF